MGRPKGFNREDVLEKALGVFWKKGFADTSLQDLEKSTGVNKSGLYSEFKNKEDLFCETLSHYYDTVGAVEILSRKPLGWKNIKDFLLYGLNTKPFRGCFGVNCVREMSILPRKARGLVEKEVTKIVDLIAKNLEAEAIANAKLAAHTIMSFNAGLRLQQNLGDDLLAVKKIELMLDFLKK